MPNVSQKEHRFYTLDLLRFLAALSVVLFHYTFLNVIEISSTPTYPILREIFKYGYLGVELFFIISGFVILLTATHKDWRGFIVSRISRLYPAFWVAVTLTTLAIMFFPINGSKITLIQYLINLTMVSEYLGVNNIEPVYWTLQVEIKFYFWMLLIIVINKVQFIERFIMAWLIISMLEIFHFKHEFTHYFLMPEWAPYFSAGALFYQIHSKGLTVNRTLLLLFSYAMAVYFAVHGASEKIISHNENFSFYVVIGIISSYFLLFSLLSLGRLSSIRPSFFVTLGAISYPLYLIHMTLGSIIFQLGEGFIDKYSFLFLVVMFMIFLSYLLNRYFELKFVQRLKPKLESWLKP